MFLEVAMAAEQVVAATAQSPQTSRLLHVFLWHHLLQQAIVNFWVVTFMLLIFLREGCALLVRGLGFLNLLHFYSGIIL